VRVNRGGQGEPVLLLLHGLGATGEVWHRWQPVLAQRWPGRWLAPDLPGHGGSPPLPRYSFDTFADAVLPLLDDAADVVVLGHSLGGAVGLALAGRCEGIRQVVGLGIKVAWTPEELDRAAGLAQRPVAWFATRQEAAARYLRVSGLAGLLDADDPTVEPGLSTEDDQWRLAMDPRTWGVGAPDLAALLAATDARVRLARGEHDAMVSDEQLRQLGVPVTTLSGLGHNAHVESPERVLDLVFLTNTQ
jgi:pimeloyl-ACP methyl ester carboxylesterase